MAYNILVVDDSQIVRSVIKKTLALAGIEIGNIYEAANGAEGLVIVKEKWIDLIFADIHMPVMTGIEFVDKLAEDGILATVPVIIVSSEGSTTRIEELNRKGIRAFVRKPFTPESIREVVSKVMGEETA